MVGKRVVEEVAQRRSKASSPWEPAGGDDCQKNLLPGNQRRELGRIASCILYLATVRRAMWVLRSLRRSTISESVSGLPSFLMTSFMMSFTLRPGVQKCS